MNENTEEVHLNLDQPLEEGGDNAESTETLAAPDAKKNAEGEKALINNQNVVESLGLESPEVTIVSKNDVEAVVVQGDAEYTIGLESLEVVNGD